MTKPKYQVLIAGEWLDVWKAKVQPSGWLHWQTKDDRTGEVEENGMSAPGHWREKRKKANETPS